MFRKLTGIFCALLLLLAPFVSAVAESCDCIHEEAGAPNLSPIPCCGPTPLPCCSEGHGETVAVPDQIAEAPTAPRIPQPTLLELLEPFTPVNEFARKIVCAPRSEWPPGALCQELNFRQSWLI